MNLTKLKLFWNLFKEGQSVSDPVKWKTHQVSVNQVAGIIATGIAISASFGYKLDVDSDTVLAVAGGIFALTNWVFTIITTDKIGAGTGEVRSSTPTFPSEVNPPSSITREINPDQTP